MPTNLGKSRLRNLNTYRAKLRKFVYIATVRFPIDRTCMVSRFHERLDALKSVRKVADELVELTLRVGVGESKAFSLNGSDLKLHMTVGCHGEIDAYVTCEWQSSEYAHAYLNLLLMGLGIFNRASNPFANCQFLK